MPTPPARITKELVSEWTVTASPPVNNHDHDHQTDDNNAAATTTTTTTTTTTPLSETLSEVDEWLTKASHWLGFSLRFDSLLDIDIVKAGLEQTLYHIPALGARVVIPNNRPNLYELALLEEAAPNQQGVVLEYYQGTITTTTIDGNNNKLPDDSDARSVWKQAGLDAPGPNYSGVPSITDPLMRARLIVFQAQQVSYLCIGINHGLCDASGYCDILQVWSHFCRRNKDGSTTTPLPDHLARRRVLGQRVCKAYKPAQSVQDLMNRLESDVGCTQNPFQFWTLASSIIPRAVWCMSRQTELELRIHRAKVIQLKEQISRQIQQKQKQQQDQDAWVSSFEVLFAAILLALQVTSGRSSNKPPPNKSHNLHVACNLRGRADRFPKDYFGNASFDFCEPISYPPPPQEDTNHTRKEMIVWSIEAVTEMAQEIHRAVRSGLAEPEAKGCKTKDWFEAARHLGLKNKYDVWAPVVFDALSGNGTFINSWDKNRWLDCSMGSSSSAAAAAASSMVAWFGVLQNLLVEVPRHNETGDSTMYLALPPVHAKNFLRFCEDQKGGDLPFEIVFAPIS